MSSRWRFAFAILLLTSFAAAASVDILPASIEQQKEDVIVSFAVANTYNVSSGVFSFTYPQNHLEYQDSALPVNTPCRVEGGQTTCTANISVVAQRPIQLRFRMRDYFQNEVLVVGFNLTSRDASVERFYQFSRAQDPNEVSLSVLNLASLFFLVFGLILWLVSFRAASASVESPRLAPFAETAKQNFFALNVLANLLIAFSAMFLLSPQISPLSPLIFVFVFVAGYLLLNRLALTFSQNERTIRRMNAADIRREAQRLQSMLSIAKVRFMRNEIDEKTFRDVTGQLELELVELQARERELRDAQPPRE